MGEVEYEPGEPRGTDWHPHRGFETVTYMIDGRFAHQDSHGGGGLITDGATQWMTAGSGILHIETPPAELVESGGTFHGIQLWVNLPRKDKFAAPRYQSIEGGQVDAARPPTTVARWSAIIAGEIDGQQGPVSTYTPITLAHATIQPGARLDVPWNRDFNALVYVLAGEGAVGPVGQLRSARASSRCWARVTGSRCRRASSQDARNPRWRFFCWAASRFASPSSTTARS